MKNISIFVFIVITSILLSNCKKYPNDSFFSTFSAKARLTNGERDIWNCIGFRDKDGVCFSIPPNHFALIFGNKEVQVHFLTLAIEIIATPGSSASTTGNIMFGEISDTTTWTFEDNKKFLNFFGKWRILSLTLNKLEIENEKGEVYYFSQKPPSIVEKIDSSIVSIPLFGLFDETSKIFNLNTCENSNTISAYNNGNPMSSTQGVLGNGSVKFGNNANISFNQYFSKRGYITFYILKKINAPNELPAFLLNNQSINPKISSFGIEGNAATFVPPSIYLTDNTARHFEWYYVEIPINEVGNNTVQILGNGGVEYTSGIDEIRFWEICQ